MNERPNRVLIAGSDPDRVLLLEEAFTEIDETRFARGFRGGWERTYAVEVQEAADELHRSSFDVVLFDQAAVMEAALPAFWALRRAARDTPVVTLISPDDELLGVGLVKNGAQDYLLESELDCVPLDRALRCSIERNRMLVAQRNVSMVDELTGVLNAKGFRQMALRDLHLAEKYDLLTFLVEVELPANDPDPDLAAIRLGDCLYRERTESDLLGRLDERVFVMAGLGENDVDVALRLQRLEAVLRAFGEVYTVSGAEAREALCDNNGVENRVGRHLQRR